MCHKKKVHQACQTVSVKRRENVREFTFTQKDNLICLRVEYRFTLLRVLFSPRPEERTKAGSTASYSFQVSSSSSPSSSSSTSSYFFCRTHGVVVSAAHSCCSQPPTPAAVPARLGLLLMLSLLIPGWTAASTTEHWHYDKRWKEKFRHFLWDFEFAGPTRPADAAATAAELNSSSFYNKTQQELENKLWCIQLMILICWISWMVLKQNAHF